MGDAPPAEKLVIVMQMDVDVEEDGRSRAKVAPTARGSTWNHTKVFSEGGSEGAPTRYSSPAPGQRGQQRPGRSVKQVQPLITSHPQVRALPAITSAAVSCVLLSGLMAGKSFKPSQSVSLQTG